MKRDASTLLVLVALLLWLLAPAPVQAATPRNGRYQGTITIRTYIEGTTTVVKKVIPVAGIYTAPTMQLVIPELPAIGPYFDSYTFNATILDGSVVMFPNHNALSLPLFAVKTTTGRVKGMTDFGLIFPPSGGGEARRFLYLTLNRVVN